MSDSDNNLRYGRLFSSTYATVKNDCAIHSGFMPDVYPNVACNSSIERFTTADLLGLRNELLQATVDSFQAAQIVINFLSGRGYGVSAQEARQAAARIEMAGATAEQIQKTLEGVALAM